MKIMLNVLEIALFLGMMSVAVSIGGDITAADSAPREGRMKTERATFAAGCFWGVEAKFRDIEGVLDTQVGYTGGKTDDPTYHDVCTDRTGHAEAVQVTFDPEVVSYDELLKAFWELHDPTQLNRQGPDYGSQYRSVIFFHGPEQEARAKASKKMLEESGRYKKPVTTEIVEAAEFYRAEEYHQQYLEKRGINRCGSH